MTFNFNSNESYYDSNRSWQIGAISFQASYHQFVGKIDDIRIWERALSADEVSQLDTIDEIYGCADPNACNFNPYVMENNDSCLYNDCNNECGGEAEVDACGICGGENVFLEYDCSDCNACELDYSSEGSECCDSAWEEYGINCATLEANYEWDCSGCLCPGDNNIDCVYGTISSDAPCIIKTFVFISSHQCFGERLSSKSIFSLNIISMILLTSLDIFPFKISLTKQS